MRDGKRVCEWMICVQCIHTALCLLSSLVANFIVGGQCACFVLGCWMVSSKGTFRCFHFLQTIF